MTRIILVTGGCGFIGANFVRLVHAERPDWRIVNVDKLTYAGNPHNLDGIAEGQNYRFVREDICNAQAMRRLFLEEKVDTVAHFAAESHVDRSISGPTAFIETNIVGTFSLLEAARALWLGDTWQGNQPCFLHVSTDEVYGSLGDSGYFTETTAYSPRSPYSASKASSDHLARAYFHTYGLPVRITNCSNNYGPYQFPEKLIPLTFNNARHGKPLPVYGDGKNIRDWLHVEDHCRAILLVIERGKDGDSYNIGGHNEKQNIEVVTTICDILDQKRGLLPGGRPRRKLISFVKDRLGHDRRYAIDAAKIQAELGWRPKMDFASGIAATIDWYLANSAWVNAVVDGSYRQYYAEMYGQALA